MDGKNDYQVVAIVAAPIFAAKLSRHGDATQERKEELMREAIGDARLVIEFSTNNITA